MGSYNSAVTTTAGQSLIARAIAGNLPCTLTSAKTTAYVVPGSTSLASLTSLPDIKQSEAITSASVVSNTQVSASVRFNNTEITLNYMINTIGVYAKAQGDGSETLLAVITAIDPDVMPSYSAASPVAYVYDITLSISNASSVNIVVAPTGSPNYSEFNAVKDEVVAARVGSDGVQYSTLEARLNAENTDLKSHIDADENLLFDISYEPVTETVTPTMTSGLCKADGSVSASSNYEYTNIIPVKPGDVIRGKAIVISGKTAPTEPCYIRYWTAYNFDTVMPNAGTDSGQVRDFTVPDGINGVRLTLNLALYESGSLSIIRHTSVENKSVKAELITTDEDIVAAVTVEKSGSNLINKSLAETGGLQQNGSIDITGSFANYKTSDYIPVKAGQTYRLYLADAEGQSTSTTRLICGVFDSTKSLLTYSNNAGISYHDITPSVDGFVRVCCTDNPAYFTTKLMLIKGTDTVPYEDYRIIKVLSDDISPVNALFPAVGGILHGKKWCPCGDSFTYYTNKQFESGKYAGLNQTYPYLIALRNGMEIESAFFNSGRTLAYPADHTFSNSLTCPTNPGYYQNIPEDADYVTIMLGINDSQHTGSGSTGDGEDATGVITLGTINDDTTATYYGAWNVVLGWLRENRPFAHVGIIITNGITANGDWKAAQIAIAKKWGYPLLDLNGDEKTPAMIRCYNPNVSDAVKEILRKKQAVDYDGSITGSVNTHPNWQAHEYESTFIEAWLQTL